MDTKKKNMFAGYFFLFLQILIIIVNRNVVSDDIFFWFCNHAPIFFSIAFFTQRTSWVKALINIGFLGQFIWALDFVFLLLGYELFGLTQYVLEKSTYQIIFPIIIHIFSAAVALALTYSKKPTKKILGYSLVYTLLLYIATLSFTMPESNINCLYKICFLQGLTFPGYIYLWPLLTFIIVVLPTHFLQYLLYKTFTNRTRTKKSK